MMSYIFGAMMVLGIIVSALTGRAGNVANSIISGGASSVEMCVELLGTVCVWTGIMEVAKGAGLCERLAALMRPVISFLFPGLSETSPKAARAVSLNITANILGLGSAATPMALEAMREMDRINDEPHRASDHMVVLTALNTASFQLIPTTVAAIRANAGSREPLDILAAVWISSAVSVVVAVLIAKCKGRNNA